MDSTLTQDTQSSNPQAMNKFENTKRKKPWEVFKKPQVEEEKPESVQQFDSFRDKCAHNMQTGAGFTAFLNNTMQQDNNFQIKLKKDQYYQNLSKSKKLFGTNNNQRPNKQGGGNNQSKVQQEETNQPRFNGVVKNNFEKQNNYYNRKNDETKENTNSQNFNKQNSFHYNPFHKNDKQETNQDQKKDDQNMNKDEISKAKYLERKQKKVNDLIELQASRALRREEGENIPSDEDPLMNYLSDSSSNESDSDENKKKRNLNSSQKKKRSGLTRRRQKICGSWVRVCDTQKLDKPPSYKDYLGALTNAKGKRPLEELSNKDEDLYEVNKELANDAEDGELKAVADIEDGEIKMQEEDFFLKNNADHKQQQFDMEFPFPTRKAQYKSHKSKNFMNISPTKILNTLRKTSLLDEEDESTYKKKQKVPTREELIEQENKLLEQQSQEGQDPNNPLLLLKKMDQLGTDAFKNRSGNNFQMQQTLAAQQDLFLHSYFNKAKVKGENLNQDPNAQAAASANAAKKEKRFDPKNYYVDIEKNMLDNKVQMTEGLLALAKIQKEQYVSGMKKKTKQNKDILSSNLSSGSGSKINKILQQDSTEKELRDASQRLTKQAGMKDLQSKLNFDQNSHHPLLIQKEKQNEQFNKALNEFEEEVNKKEQLIKQIQLQKKKEEKMNQNSEKPEEKDKQEGSKQDGVATTEENAEKKEGEDMGLDDDDLNEFEKFNEEYLKQQEKMIEEIQKKNKEKVNEIKNSKLDLGLGLDFGLDSNNQKEELLNPLEKMIQEELERNRQDKQQQNFRLMELQKLQGNQHIQHVHMLAKSTVNESSNYYKNSNANENPYAKISQSNLHAMSTNPTDNQQNKRRNKFSEIPTLPTQYANVETFAQMERLKYLTQAQKSSHQPYQKIQQNGSNSLSQLQEQLFTRNQQVIKDQMEDRSNKMDIEHSNNKSSKFSSFPSYNQPKYNQNNDHQIQQIGEVPSRKSSFDKSVTIPEVIKSMEMKLKPERYEKMVLEYINNYKKQKEEIQLERIKDPRLRARATNNFEDKISQFTQQLIQGYTEKVNNYIPMANEECSLPLPSLQDDSGNKRKTSLLNFQVETKCKSEESDDKVVYNYKVLKSDRNFITQEKNLIEKHSAISFLQGSSQGPDAVQLLRTMSQKEESVDNQNIDEFKDLFKNEKELRYFKENNAMFCFKCNRNGHTAKLCTSQFEEKNKCVFCLGDHSKDYCTNYVCFKCYLVGHRIKDCAFEQSMDQSRCRICRKKGHTLKQCGSLNLDIVQKSYDYNSMNETICLNCREPGHINCFNPQQLYINYDGLYKLDQETLDKLI